MKRKFFRQKCTILFALLQFIIPEALGIPVDLTEIESLVDEEDPATQHEYDTIKRGLVSEFGYSRDFANLVEANLKRAIREEKLRQFGLTETEFFSSSPSTLTRQGNQGAEEEEDDDATPPTTARASPADVLRGVAQLVSSLGTFNAANFWGSFVNFFPPSQREGAQALVDAALGRRPQSWPTTPTTTPSTTPKDDDLDSEETTKVTVVVITGAPAQTATTAPAISAPAAAVVSTYGQSTVTKAPAVQTQTATRLYSYIPGSELPPTQPPTRATTRYSIKRRTGTRATRPPIRNQYQHFIPGDDENWHSAISENLSLRNVEEEEESVNLDTPTNELEQSSPASQSLPSSTTKAIN